MNTEKMLLRAGCRLKILCDQKWTDFEHTGEANIRFCKLCEKLVF